MSEKEIIQTIKIKIGSLSQFLNEKAMRIWAAVEARSLGHGGVSIVAEATGLSRTTIHAGIRELNCGASFITGSYNRQRLRKPGGGRKKLTEKMPGLIQSLESLVEPLTRGDPESPLRWTCKSTGKLAEELRKMGFRISQHKVWELLSDLGYSLQANKKTKEGSDHPDRDAQFLYISEKVRGFQERNLPVISVDTKKKELIGEYKNNGREWRPKGCPTEVNGHDFPDKKSGKVIPYGVYDITSDKGWVSVGIDHDTAEFAVASIRRWWYEMGQIDYKGAKEILITADCGGSNGYRVRLWKSELRRLADELNMKFHICHFPPGTSKWNKIEHRMFSYISKNWRGQPLISREVVINLISNTKTKTGLEIKAGIDQNNYEKGKKISDKEFESISVEKDQFHGDWNYKIIPSPIF
jgi:transposase